ncbi:MAG: alpha/beta fold hydrolase [Alphaproteobacteria bacterium]
MTHAQTFKLGDFTLQSGRVLPDARLVYAVYGEMNAAKSNVVLYPTSYGAQHTDIAWAIGADRILDPNRWCVVVVNKFGNGQSTSPSNVAAPVARGRWPAVTHVDNVTAQARLLTEELGVEELALVYGWSMGGQQALHWAALHPDRVRRICAVCTSARTSVHNKVFLEGVKGALTADPNWTGTHFRAKPEAGLRAMGRVYAGWAMSQAFYRQGLHISAANPTLEDFLVRVWEGNFLRRDGDDLLAMLETWTLSDISANDLYQGDLNRALGAIRARAMIMPSRTDLYFTPEDAEAEARRMPNAEFRPIESVWGHRAGNPIGHAPDRDFIRRAVEDLTAD